MRSAHFAALLFGAAVAQSTIDVFEILGANGETLTMKGSDAKATTYERVCPASTSGGKSSMSESTSAPVSSDSSPTGTDTETSTSTISAVELTPIPSPETTELARLFRRQEEESFIGCLNYTIIQGSESWSQHWKDAETSGLGFDAKCTWKGASTSADWTCSVSQDGLPENESATESYSIVDGSTVGVYSAAEMASNSAFVKATVVGAATTGAQPSGSPTGSPSSAFAASGPLPTGAMVLAGGAAAIAAAAMGL